MKCILSLRNNCEQEVRLGIRILFVLLCFVSFSVMASELVVSYVKNNASYSSDGVDFHPLKVGVILKTKDYIRTGEHSLVLMKFEGSTVKIGSNSNLRVEEILIPSKHSKDKKGKKKTSFFMFYGNLIFDFINPQKDSDLEINTNYISLGVRGTRFFMYLTKENPVGAVSVLEGEVQVRKSDGTQVRLIKKDRSIVLDQDQNLSLPAYQEWQEKINWEVNETKELKQNEMLFKMIEKVAYKGLKGEKESLTSGLIDKALGLKEIFKEECKKKNYEACVRYASIEPKASEELLWSCMQKSRYGCYMLGQLDEKTLTKKISKEEMAKLTKDLPKGELKDLQVSCIQGNTPSCFAMGKRGHERPSDDYSLQLLLGHKKEVLMVLGKHCAGQNPLACGEFVRERMKDRQYAKEKGLSEKELMLMAKKGDVQSGGKIKAKENGQLGVGTVNEDAEIVCHYKEFPLLIKIGKGLCQAQIVCEVNKHRIDDLALCQAIGNRCPDVYDCIIDDKVDVDLPENAQELTVLKK